MGLQALLRGQRRNRFRLRALRPHPTEDAWFTFFLEDCGVAFGDYVGRSYETALDFAPFTPTEEGWDDGDRVVQCALVDPSNTELTESLRDAAR